MTRLVVLDGLRGFALFGISLGNVTWFSGTAVLSPDARSALGTETVDGVVRWLVHVLVDGKFYSLFALLFGIGFGLALQRAVALEVACAAFRRRMLVLALVGGLHATLLWFGDIVSLYAVTGLLLPVFARCSSCALLRWSIAAMVAPVLISVGIWLLHNPSVSGDPGHGPAALLAGFSEGGYLEMLRANLAFLQERWILALQSGRFCKLLGLFLLGVYCVRRGIVTAPGEHRALLGRVFRIGLLVGLPANVALAWFLTNVSERPPSLLGCARTTVYVIAAPTLALAYASGAVLLALDRAEARVLAGFAAVGRMTFTHYLVQSAVGIAVFYGVGLGLWGQYGEAIVVAVLPVLFGLQVVVSIYWLRRFSAGPVEALVRRLRTRRA